jgi:hypothetical protein
VAGNKKKQPVSVCPGCCPSCDECNAECDCFETRWWCYNSADCPSDM